jgi:hypothetical protein
LVYFFPFWYVWAKKNLATLVAFAATINIQKQIHPYYQCDRIGRNFAIWAISFVFL